VVEERARSLSEIGRDASAWMDALRATVHVNTFDVGCNVVSSPDICTADA
jgi:hypothetical protein